MYKHFQAFVQKLFIALTLFSTVQLSAQTTTSCAKYEVISTNNICGCATDLFRPYGLFMEANNACGLEYFKPDTVYFEIRDDSTAAIRGVFRTFQDWRPVRVDISLAKLPSGTPRLDLCLNNSSPSVANAWRYFGAMTGTIQFDGAAPLSVSLRGSNFQVGIGANGQNLDLFGGSGFFTLSNGQRGGFGFTLTNPSAGTCLLSDPCQTDATPPAFSNCPQNINLTTSGTSTVATWTAPTATDNCTVPSVSSNFSSGATFPIGTTSVIYTATDAKNNTAECRFNVTVTLADPCLTDVLPPVFSNCPQNINLSTSTTSALATWTAPTATDNCSIPSLSSNYSPNSEFPVGTTTVVYTAQDAKNNTAQCRFNVVVTFIDPCLSDITPPVFSNCPQNINLTTVGTNAIARWTAPTATDNCPTLLVSNNYASGTSFPIGTTTVIYTAQDGRNNTVECRFTVTVTYLDPCVGDITPPEIVNCPQNISLTTTGTTAIATWAAPSVTDNCAAFTILSNYRSGTAFPIGTTTVIYTANDVANNTAQCHFTVTVTSSDPCLNDVVAPVFSNCPQNISLTTTGTSAVATWTAPTATDNCTTPSVSNNITSGATFLIGTTTVIYTARDAANNTAQCRFNVIVTKRTATAGICTSYAVDNTNDICSCPTNQWIPYGLFIEGSGGCGDYYKADKVDFQINGDSSARLVGVFRTNTWRPVWLDIQWAKSASGTPRFSTCANDTIAAHDWRYFGTAQGNIQFDNEHTLSITNNGLLQVGISANGQNRDLFGASGRITLGDGRVGSVNFVLNNPISSTCELACVNDVVAPEILNCPRNITQLVVQAPVATTWAAPSVRDACSSPTLTTTHLPGALFGAGETNVVYTARDVSGNQSTCTFKVTINQVAPGSLCSTYDVDNTNDICGCSANQWKPYALRIGDNNCGEYFKSDTAILYINGDNSAQLQGRFRSDTWQPVMVDVHFEKTSIRSPRFELCQNSTVVTTDWQYFSSISGTIKIGDGAPIAVQAGSLFQIGKGANGQNKDLMGGNINFSLQNGLPASLNLVLTNYQQFTCPNYNPCAVDVTKPTFTTCPRDTTVETTESAAIINWLAPTATDNCAPPSVTSNFSSGASFPVGTTVVTYTAKDLAENSSVCTFSVTVVKINPCALDLTPPVIVNCPSNILDSTIYDSKPIWWDMPTVTDNCSTPSVSSNFPPGLPFNIGNTIISITARDAAGNTSKCYFNITITKKVAINEPNAPISQIHIAPNPATQQITLELQSRLTEDVQLDIHNALGQVVLKQKISVKAGDNRVPIDISFLAKGIYYLSVRNTQFSAPKTVRFMKI